MERREFLRSTCCACLGTGGLPAFLISCAGASVYRAEMNHNMIRVPESIFDTGDVQLIRAPEFADDIALVRSGGRQYRAITMRCTHADNPLSYRGGEFTCSLHGSRFSTGGDVTHGPARLPLRGLETSVGDGVVTIHVEKERTQ